MLISCPNCATNFSVPETALGSSGRTLKCAKCGHKWFQAAAGAETDFALDEDSFPPVPSAVAEPEPEEFLSVSADEPAAFQSVMSSRPAMSSQPAPSRMEPLAPETEIPEFDLGPTFNLADDSDSHVVEEDRSLSIDLDAPPDPIPDVFSSPEEPTRKGTGILWALLVLFLLGGAGGALYQFQDRVVEFWPPAHTLLSDLGLRKEKPGAGLEFRNAGSPERMVVNETEVLVVRGIIANISDTARPVPQIKLVLFDKDKKSVQEKLFPPPVSALDPAGTASFRLTLERPEPQAVEVNVLFVGPSDTH